MQGKWHERYELCYRTLYILGVETLLCLRRIGKMANQYFRPVFRGLYKAADWLLLRHVRAAWKELVRIGRGFAAVPRYIRAHGWRALALPAVALKRHEKAVKTVLNWAAPVAGAVLLVLCLNHYLGLRFALEVTYRGESIGLIADETVFDAAADMAVDRVVNPDESFTVDRVPSLTLAVVGGNDLLDKEALCNNILGTAGDSIAEMAGLYIDGDFKGALTSSSIMNALLDDIKAPYLSGDKNERAEFVADVQVVPGLYPVSSAVKFSEMKELLTSQSVVANYYTVQKGDSLSKIARAHNMSVDDLRVLNPEMKGEKVFVGQQLLVQRAQPYLRVQTVRTINYSEVIPYQTQKTFNSTKKVTWERVKQKGQNGSRDIVCDIIYRDGAEVARVIVSNTVTKEPVTRIVEAGSVPVYSSSGQAIVQGDGIATGEFIWPVPICTNMSRGWFSGHGGLDICNGPVTVNKKLFYAADGGTVVQINTKGWGGGYGLYVVIDHGNGLKTLYAHCSELHVVLGQKVSKAQPLGRIGSTGQSTGPHLHFEVRKNDRRVNPLNYVKPSKW